MGSNSTARIRAKIFKLATDNSLNSLGGTLCFHVVKEDTSEFVERTFATPSFGWQFINTTNLSFPSAYKTILTALVICANYVMHFVVAGLVVNDARFG